eukprot:scaffold49723_cov28-Tisochrysis_lutea.AAC.1
MTRSGASRTRRCAAAPLASSPTAREGGGAGSGVEHSELYLGIGSRQLPSFALLAAVGNARRGERREGEGERDAWARGKTE